MADAPAPSGGSGWGALEVILALVLAIGLISTLTGNSIPSLAGSSTNNKIATTKPSVTQPACGIIVSSPSHQEKIGTEVLLSGTVAQCLTSTIPDTLIAHVVDSTGASLSAVMAVTVDHGFFGNATFSTSIPLVGIAHSIQAYVIVSGPTHADGSANTVRVPIQLIPSDPSIYPAPAPTTFSTTSSTTNYYTTPNPAPSYAAPTYIAPTPAPTSMNYPTQSNPSSTLSAGNGTTF